MANKQIGISLIMVLFFLLIMTMLAITAWRIAILETKVVAYSAESDQLKKMAEKAVDLVEKDIENLGFSTASCFLPRLVDNCISDSIDSSYLVNDSKNKTLRTIVIDKQTYYLKGYWQEAKSSNSITDNSDLKFYEITAGAENDKGDQLYIRTLFSRYYFK